MESVNIINKKSQSSGKIVVENIKSLEDPNQKVNIETASTVNNNPKKSNSSRYKSLLKALGDTVKKRKEDKENAKFNEGKKIERLKSNLGLDKIKPKIVDKTKKNVNLILPNINLNINRPLSTIDNQLVTRKTIPTKNENEEKDIIIIDNNNNYLEKPKTSSQAMVEKQLRVINELEKKNKNKKKSFEKPIKQELNSKNIMENDDEFHIIKEETKPFKSKFIQNCASFEEWKRKNKIDKDQKVFFCSKEYPDIKKTLLNRGWIQNDDPKSVFFDLKWVLGTKDIDYSKLTKNQIINRFEKTGILTRKSGLCKSLRNLIWFSNVDIDTFYPKCYDLSEAQDFNDFIQEFKILKAECILKDFMNKKDTQYSIEQIITSILIIERKLKDINDIIDENESYNQNVSEKEWQIISNEEEEYDLEIIKKNLHMKQSMKDENLKDNQIADKKLKSKKKIKLEKNKKIPIKEDEIEQLEEKVKNVLEMLGNKSPQFKINGSKNIWIVKPVGLSRGRGIQCISGYQEFLGFLKIHGNQYVIQKYIENPLIIFGRKFDIRQWVLVTDWNPLTIWIYETPYLRLGAEDYSLEKLNNLFIHLTNNSIAKNSKQFINSKIEGNMISCEDFQIFLKEKYGNDVWSNVLKEKIKHLVIWSLESAQDIVENRKNSNEIFGFDIMIDEELNPWLIEINSSPCMEYSTKITEKLVKSVLPDTLKVALDYNSAPKNIKDTIDTGLWKLVHKGQLAETNTCLGLNLVCTGTKIKAEPDL